MPPTSLQWPSYSWSPFPNSVQYTRYPKPTSFQQSWRFAPWDVLLEYQMQPLCARRLKSSWNRIFFPHLKSLRWFGFSYNLNMPWVYTSACLVVRGNQYQTLKMLWLVQLQQQFCFFGCWRIKLQNLHQLVKVCMCKNLYCVAFCSKHSFLNGISFWL